MKRKPINVYITDIELYQSLADQNKKGKVENTDFYFDHENRIMFIPVVGGMVNIAKDPRRERDYIVINHHQGKEREKKENKDSLENAVIARQSIIEGLENHIVDQTINSKDRKGALAEINRLLRDNDSKIYRTPTVTTAKKKQQKRPAIYNAKPPIARNRLREGKRQRYGQIKKSKVKSQSQVVVWLPQAKLMNLNMVLGRSNVIHRRGLPDIILKSYPVNFDWKKDRARNLNSHDGMTAHLCLENETKDNEQEINHADEVRNYNINPNMKISTHKIKNKKGESLREAIIKSVTSHESDIVKLANTLSTHHDHNSTMSRFNKWHKKSSITDVGKARKRIATILLRANKNPKGASKKTLDDFELKIPDSIVNGEVTKKDGGYGTTIDDFAQDSVEKIENKNDAEKQDVMSSGPRPG